MGSRRGDTAYKVKCFTCGRELVVEPFEPGRCVCGLPWEWDWFADGDVLEFVVAGANYVVRVRFSPEQNIASPRGLLAWAPDAG